MKFTTIGGKRFRKFDSKAFSRISILGQGSKDLVTGAFEVIGRIAKRHLHHFWGDLVHDIHSLEIVAAQLEKAEIGSTIFGIWVVRDSGTHFFTYATADEQKEVEGIMAAAMKHDSHKAAVKFKFTVEDKWESRMYSATYGVFVPAPVL